MQLFDTLSKGLVELPEAPAPVRMYICGPTVYARAHVGNARPFVIGMWFTRWLRARGNDVTFVHNITDVNDKIYEAAPGASAALAAEATTWYLTDVAGFGLGMPDHLPKVTELMPEIITFVAELVRTGHAYESGGDVYFRVSSYPAYGALSGQLIDQVEVGEAEQKEDPRDFALWKATKPGEDTSWDSPWGDGRPGWHIECSAMADHLLGHAFEIHGGGLDLVFPHHENELAQSRALGHDFARIWAHNGMLRFTGEKMSKSIGNIATIRELLDEWGAHTLLLYFLTAHWRSPIDFSESAMEQARARGATLRNALRLEPAEHDEARWQDLVDALEDDFDTPKALAVLHEWASTRQLELLRRGLDIFGLGSLDEAGAVPPEVQLLADQRLEARRDRNYDEADRLRGEIEAAGWEVRDTSDGQTLVPHA